MPACHISFYIPTYNRAKYLNETILSLVTQSSFDPTIMEVIICDDTNTDNTYEIVSRLQKKYHNIHYIYNKKNL